MNKLTTLDVSDKVIRRPRKESGVLDAMRQVLAQVDEDELYALTMQDEVQKSVRDQIADAVMADDWDLAKRLKGQILPTLDAYKNDIEFYHFFRDTIQGGIEFWEDAHRRGSLAASLFAAKPAEPAKTTLGIEVPPGYMPVGKRSLDGTVVTVPLGPEKELPVTAAPEPAPEPVPEPVPEGVTADGHVADEAALEVENEEKAATFKPVRDVAERPGVWRPKNRLQDDMYAIGSVLLRQRDWKASGKVLMEELDHRFPETAQSIRALAGGTGLATTRAAMKRRGYVTGSLSTYILTPAGKEFIRTYEKNVHNGAANNGA